MKTIAKVFSIFALLALLVLSGCASNPQSKNGWPANSDEVLRKTEISYPIGKNSFLVVNPQKATYNGYSPTNIPCKVGTFSKVVKVSEYIVEFDASPKKDEKCFGVLLRIDTQAKNSNLMLYDYTGNPAHVKQSYWLTNPSFSN